MKGSVRRKPPAGFTKTGGKVGSQPNYVQIDLSHILAGWPVSLIVYLAGLAVLVDLNKVSDKLEGDSIPYEAIMELKDKCPAFKAIGKQRMQEVIKAVLDGR